MDRITQSLLAEYTKQHEISMLPEETQFEYFACYATVRRHYGATFDATEVITGSGGDTAIDGIAIIVNGELVTDLDEFEDRFSNVSYLEATFVFLQATRSSAFDGSKISNFAFGVMDFFSSEPRLPRNERIQDAAAIMSAIYDRSSKFGRGNPDCKLYYVSTGKLDEKDANLTARRETAAADLASTGLFGDVSVALIGANEIQKLYRQATRALIREFSFPRRTVVPEIPGIVQAYLGYIPAREFINVIADDDEIVRSLFYENVRDYKGANAVNEEIKSTVCSDGRSRFVLMNNGVTIIARKLQLTADASRLKTSR